MRYKGVLIDDISMFNTPQLYLNLSIELFKDFLSWLKSIVLTRALHLLIFVAIWLTIANLSVFTTLYQFILFSVYWIVLGIASSIGLGTGLHTFILYLGPHIAKVTLTATICGSIPQMLPSRWTFDHFAECSKQNKNTIGFFGILLAVQLQSFLWGLGTAIGELPPYFVAKKAAQTRAELKRMALQAERLRSQEEVVQLQMGESDILIEAERQKVDTEMDEIEQITQLKRKQNLNIMDRAKLLIFTHMEKYGFWTILACASIPNPLFDLAGITSGHFRIPFKTFFSATFIGKAIIKVHIQMLFIIVMFRKETLNILIKFIELISAGLADSFTRGLEAKKKQLNQPDSFKDNQSFLSVLWDLFITAMVLYFLKSILDSYVKEKAIALRDS